MKKIIFTYFLLFSVFYYSNAQCFPDRHNTTWFDSWISCDATVNPNTARDTSHWIMYDLGADYILKDLHFWNLNIPNRTNEGVRSMAIDVSSNGVDWIEAGEYTIEEADASSTYEGLDLDEFKAISGQFILITILENWGGKCSGFSELKINVEPKIISSVNPSNKLRCKPKGNGILLEWSEENHSSKDITLEVSKDGVHWSPFNQGSSSNHGNTLYWSDNHNENGYYRVKQSIQGVNQFSKVHFCTRSNLHAEVWPNPMEKFGTLRIASTSKEHIKYSIETTLGIEVYHKTVPCTGPITNIELHSNALNRGTYTITVSQGSQTTTTKLIKL